MRAGRGAVLVLVAGLWCAADTAAAQTIPPSADPGLVPQRFERAPQPKALPRVGGIQLPSTVPPANAEGITLSVSRFEITGSSVYSDGELNELVQPLIDRRIPLTEVYALAARITAKYGQDGYVLSRAIIPPQALSRTGAVVRIEVVEGYVADVIWPEGLQQRYRDFFSDYAAQITASRPANIKIIERYLLLASDLPGLTFSSTFKPSPTQPRATTLVVTASEKPVSVEASVDNRGSEGRGPWQAQVAGTASNWLGLHEALSLKYATTVPSDEQLRFIEGQWRQVLTSEGLTLTVTGSYNTGIPGLPPLEAIEYESEGIVVSAMLSYPVIRTRDENLVLSGIGFIEDVKSRALDAPFTDDRLRGVRLRAEYDNADTHGGINLLQVTVSQGIDGLGSTGNGNALASRATGRVDFTKIEATASRAQQLDRIVPGLSLYGALHGQYAWDPLLVVEQCSYGGKSFGRAFDPSALAGDHCLTSIAELRYDLSIPNSPFSYSQIYGFIDHGYVERITTSPGTPKTEWGSSAGAGVRLGWRENVSLGLEAGREIAGDLDVDWRGHVDLTVRY